MRIVFSHDIFSAQQTGGISRYFCELARELAVLGADFRVVAGRFTNRHLRDAASDPKLAGRISGTYVRANAYSRFLLRFVNEISGALAVRHEPRFLLHRTYYPPFAALRGVALVTTVYDMVWERFPGASRLDPVSSALKRRAVDRADLVIAISNATARDLTSLWNVPEEKIRVVPLGVASPSAPVAAVAAPRPFLLHVGRRGGYKDFAVLLDALSRAAGPVREAELVCFGGGSWTSGERAAIDRLGLAGRVRHHHGDDADLAAHYRAAVALVYPSRYEGFGLPLIEAMSHDCPVICSDTAALVETAGGAARHFEAGSPAALADALEWAFTDSEGLAELRRLGRRRWPTLTWRRCAERTFAVYRELG